MATGGVVSMVRSGGTRKMPHSCAWFESMTASYQLSIRIPRLTIHWLVRSSSALYNYEEVL